MQNASSKVFWNIDVRISYFTFKQHMEKKSLYLVYFWLSIKSISQQYPWYSMHKIELIGLDEPSHLVVNFSTMLYRLLDPKFSVVANNVI